MKVSFSWIKDHIDIEASVSEVEQKLTKSGLEVEGVEQVESVKGGLEGMVVGEVLSCVPHPGADKLSLTTVNIGQEEPSPIVCGAPNVAAGQKVIVATVGAVLYPADGESFKIKKAKIRGEVSLGMICAEDELGLGASHDGIMVLDTPAVPGTPAAEVLNLTSETVIEIGLTPNRADAASHYGVAREIQALFPSRLKAPTSKKEYPTNDLSVTVKVENKKDCLRYAAVEIENLKVQDSPDWLQKRLKSIGVEPINNVVDVTNYILHDLGQPLHAFDSAKITEGEVRVKNLPEATLFTTLDEQERKLNHSDLMICNGDTPMCIAGVFGGIESGVTDTTTKIFLESAYFSPDAVRKSSLSHGLKTDASFRFERGTDPSMPVDALKKAVDLLEEIAGGKVSSKIYDYYPEPVKPFVFDINTVRINDLLGITLSDDQIEKILSDLDIVISNKNDADWSLEVPAYRVDVQREADIAEELLRIYGYDNIPLSADLSTSFLANDNADADEKKSVISQYLAANGLNEIVTNSLTKEAYYQGVEELKEEEHVLILNRLSEDLGVMRRTLLFNGLEVIAHNVNRKQTNNKLFEFGRVYNKESEGYSEENMLALFAQGKKSEGSWIKPQEDETFHSLSELLVNVLSRLKITNYVTKPVSHTFFLEGLELATPRGEVFGAIGVVSPKETKKVGLKDTVYYAELNLDKLYGQKRKPLVFKGISKFPEVKRDLSIVLDKNISFAEVETLTRKIEKNFMRSINVFDVYEGEHVGEGKKSYSVSYILQDDKQTLQDKVIDKIMNKLINAYEQELGAVIRK